MFVSAFSVPMDSRDLPRCQTLPPHLSRNEWTTSDLSEQTQHNTTQQKAAQEPARSPTPFGDASETILTHNEPYSIWNQSLQQTRNFSPQGNNGHFKDTPSSHSLSFTTDRVSPHTENTHPHAQWFRHRPHGNLLSSKLHYHGDRWAAVVHTRKLLNYTVEIQTVFEHYFVSGAGGRVQYT